MTKKPDGTPDKHKSSGQAAVAEFVAKAKALGPLRADGRRGRLVFALDATMSRQPTWDTACQLQAEMFAETGRIGGLDVQLVYFRGFGE
ncbi:MAG: VWA domain-containing protein, partial [Rhizobiales bacterium]|nr:VWA domain-containing protein [Hyphomicrobiales bacterium]